MLVINWFNRTAQKKEIIKAYRKLAQQWHPDNFQDPEDKKAAEKKFIDIAQAKEVLTDPGKHSSEVVSLCKWLCFSGILVHLGEALSSSFAVLSGFTHWLTQWLILYLSTAIIGSFYNPG